MDVRKALAIVMSTPILQPYIVLDEGTLTITIWIVVDGVEVATHSFICGFVGPRNLELFRHAPEALFGFYFGILLGAMHCAACCVLYPAMQS